jgi:hypothetical protein
MSFPLGFQGHAAVEAIVACDRLALKLTDFIAQHAHAASVARPGWTGPHHDAFEERFAAVQSALGAGVVWVLRVRHEAEARLAALQLEAEEAAARPRATEPR